MYRWSTRSSTQTRAKSQLGSAAAAKEKPRYLRLVASVSGSKWHFTLNRSDENGRCDHPLANQPRDGWTVALDINTTTGTFYHLTSTNPRRAGPLDHGVSSGSHHLPHSTHTDHKTKLDHHLPMLRCVERYLCCGQ